MAKMLGSSFSHRAPDFITEGLAVALSRKIPYEFQPLFDIVYANLCAQNHFGAGEKRSRKLRLRTYDKLQLLVDQGMVKKTITQGIKEYRGLASLASEMPYTISNPN